MDGAEKIPGRLIVAGGNCPVLLQLAEEVFHERPLFVEFPVDVAFDLAIALRWDHRGFTRRYKRFDDPLIGVKCFVAQQSISFHLRQQHVGARKIVNLAAGEEKGKWIAERIDQGVDFGAQASFAASDRLVFASFFWAPALC